MNKFAATAIALCLGAASLAAQAQTAGKVDPYTQGAKAGKPDPYTDGAKAGKFDPYTEGAKKNTAESLTDASAPKAKPAHKNNGQTSKKSKKVAPASAAAAS
ncbi:amino acid ABC transporter permease [Burkholderiaceae bacterium 16]|nr:amino acid ABC transporter permease [Burkholderiaceae bacterium 16]